MIIINQNAITIARETAEIREKAEKIRDILHDVLDYIKYFFSPSLTSSLYIYPVRNCPMQVYFTVSDNKFILRRDKNFWKYNFEVVPVRKGNYHKFLRMIDEHYINPILYEILKETKILE